MKGLNSLAPSSIHDSHQPWSSELRPLREGWALTTELSPPCGGKATGHGAQTPQGGTGTGHGAWSPWERDGHRPRSSVPLGEGWALATELGPPGRGTATGHGAQSPSGRDSHHHGTQSPSGSSAAWSPQQDEPEFLALKDCAS